MKGNLIIKIRGRDEAYWTLTLLAMLPVWGVGKSILVPAVLAVFVAVRFTLLRDWNVRRTQWTADRDSLCIDGRTVLRKDITDVGFRPSKGYSASWYLDIKAGKTLRLECFGAPEALRKESLDSLKALAIAANPRLAEHPELFPD